MTPPICDLATGLPDSSLFDKWFGGDQTLASFGKDIASFGTDMSNYYAKVASIDLIINVVTELLISVAFFVTTSANDFITDSIPGVVRVLPFEIEARVRRKQLLLEQLAPLIV